MKLLRLRALVSVAQIIFSPLASAAAGGAPTEDLLMRAALELAQEQPQAEAHLKQIIADGNAAGRTDLVTQAAQLLAIAPLSHTALAQGLTRKRHVYAEIALGRGAALLSHADRLQLERIAADGYFDAKDLVRARAHYASLIQEATGEQDREAAHYAQYRLAWVDWNEKQVLNAWDRLAGLLSGVHGRAKPALRLLAAKDLGRLILECPVEGAPQRARIFVHLMADLGERAEAVRGFAQALKRLVTESELAAAWVWLEAIADQGGEQMVGATLARSLEVGEPWSRSACATLDRLNALPQVRSAARDADWNSVVLACLQKDASPTRTRSVVQLGRSGLAGILGQSEVSAVLVKRLMQRRETVAASESDDLLDVLSSCSHKCWKDAQSEAALWRAWAVALPNPADEKVRGAVDRYLEGERNTSLTPQDWALELALSPANTLSPRLMERLREQGTGMVALSLQEETSRRYLAMRARGEWVIEESAARSLPQWLSCALRTEGYLAQDAKLSVSFDDRCASANRDWAWLHDRISGRGINGARDLRALEKPFRFNPQLPGRVERDIKQMRRVLNELERRVWTDARFLKRAQSELHSRVIAPWMARLESVALPEGASPELAALKDKLVASVRGIVSELGADFGGAR